jgi:DNA primase
LYETRLARRPLKRLLVVEGYMDVVRLHQAGVTDAVATLGTATTAEHLRRAFRLVSEVVFCFDGDRAGRAAAWRALQQALPEARAGRELRFLFLPDGEDPDSLVGREGGEQFAARLDRALPLSEYLVAQLGEQADVSHADGKAHFVALVKPLLEKIAPGVYRELLLDRVAAAIGLPAERLQQWLAGAETPAAGTVRGARVPVGAPVRDPVRGTVRAVGRGSLVTQAITLLLHFPTAASAVSEQQRHQLTQMKQDGVAVLVALLEQLGANPAATMAQTLERWRDKREYRRLCELGAGAPLVPDQAAARQELSQAAARLLDSELRRRLEVLIEKARGQTLDDAEKLELQALTMAQTRVGGG